MAWKPGWLELVIILVIVLLLFGPGRIVKIARELGQGIRNFREGLGGEKDNKSEETDKPDETDKKSS